MTEHQLYRTEGFRPAVDQRCFGSAHRVCSIRSVVKSDGPHPAMHESRVLARREVRRGMDSSRKQKVGRSQRSCLDPTLHAIPRLLGDLDCTGRWIFCCMTVVRGATREPWQTSRTRNLVRSQARSLLSIARLNIARSRVFAPSCRRIRIAQISLSFRGSFCPVSLPLFHGTRGSWLPEIVSMMILLSRKGRISLRQRRWAIPDPLLSCGSTRPQ